MTMTADRHYTNTGTSTRGGTDWRALANCLDADTNLFYTVDNELGRSQKTRDFKDGRIKTAKTICSECLVRRECLRFALKVDDRYGIFGGLTPTERGTGRP